MSKIALITGATAGIGEACAHRFAKEQFNLIVVGRREDRLQTLVSSLYNKYGTEAIPLTLDVRDQQETEAKLEALSGEWKKIDVLINNAGLSQGLNAIHEGDAADWDTMIDTNIKGLLYVSRIVSGWMVKLRAGHIINIGSIAGKEVYAAGNVYCATKHAVDALNKAMRIDLLPHNIRVTAIHPGAVETEFSEVRFKGDTRRAKKVYEGFEPLVAADIADAIWYAASRPAHVNINELTIMPLAQANTTYLHKEE